MALGAGGPRPSLRPVAIGIARPLPTSASDWYKANSAGSVEGNRVGEDTQALAPALPPAALHGLSEPPIDRAGAVEHAPSRSSLGASVMRRVPCSRTLRHVVQLERPSFWRYCQSRGTDGGDAFYLAARCAQLSQRDGVPARSARSGRTCRLHAYAERSELPAAARLMALQACSHSAALVEVSLTVSGTNRPVAPREDHRTKRR